jgi:hypothetical protein
MDPNDLLHGHGEHAERIIQSQVVLGRERKSAHVLQFLDVVGMHARRIKLLSVVGNMLIGQANRLPKP